MQIDVFVLEAIFLIIFAIGVGTLASMLGIGGGIINTPLLIIVFFLSTQIAPSAALIAAFFVAIVSTIMYHRQNPRPIINKMGLFLALTTIPGSWVGVWLRSLITDDYLLRLIFGILLFPIALKMLFAKKRAKSDFISEIAGFDFSQVPQKRLVFALIGGFAGGTAAGLLGVGGGVIVVPVLCFIVGLPMHAAVATSMFTMIFTTTSGTVVNYLVLSQIGPDAVGTFIYYGVFLGVGMIVGGQIGPRIACKINAVKLKQFFGLVLVFPLVKMMKLGQIWLDPMGLDYILATIGDLIIWLIIVVPIGIAKFLFGGRHPIVVDTDTDDCESPM
jgi:uncharacterized membrane protein YfcA